MSFALAPNSPIQLYAGATTGTGGIFRPNGQSNNITLSFAGSGTITGGVITIEECYQQIYPLNGATEPDVAGTWSSIQTITGTAITAGAVQTVHVYGSFWAVRARISTAISGGGTVTGTAWGS